MDGCCDDDGYDDDGGGGGSGCSDGSVLISWKSAPSLPPSIRRGWSPCSRFSSSRTQQESIFSRSILMMNFSSRILLKYDLDLASLTTNPYPTMGSVQPSVLPSVLPSLSPFVHPSVCPSVHVSSPAQSSSLFPDSGGGLSSDRLLDVLRSRQYTSMQDQGDRPSVFLGAGNRLIRSHCE